MKKTLLFITAIAIGLLTSNNVVAQAFEKGNVNIDVGLGFGAYGTKTTFTTPEIDFGFFVLPPQTFTETDGAASTMIPIGFEYGISNKFGLGVELGFVNYFVDDSTENDDGTTSLNLTKTVKSVDFMIFCNYHLLNADKNDLFIGLGIGGSNVVWNFKDSGYEYSGGGSIFKLYIKDRIFFSDNIGILFNLGYTGYVYNNMETSDNNPFLESLKWNVRGVNIGTGLAVKF
jgi:hypothetical protein